MPNPLPPSPPPTLAAAQSLRDAILPLAGCGGDYAPLCEWIGHSRIVLLGGSTYGTHEFARARAEITKRLITEHGFTSVAIAADSHAGQRVHRFVQGEGSDREAIDALADFHAFPGWAWRNADFLDFIGWLQAYNNSPTHAAGQAVGFHGLDLFQFHTAVGHLLRFMRTSDSPGLADAAARAVSHFSAFEHFAPFSDAAPLPTAPVAGIGTELPDNGLELSADAEEEALRHLVSRFRPRLIPPYLIGSDTPEAAEPRLFAAALPYYETLLRDQAAFWNLRERTMADSLDHLLRHLGPGAKVVLWAHNIRLGDARATEISAAGEISLGQLIRERHAANTFLVGMTTGQGTFTTAAHWGDPPERRELLPAIAGSVEALFHQTDSPCFLLDLKEEEAAEILEEPLLQRAIGPVYHPSAERECHYFQAAIAEQFDAVVHFDETRAVEPLES